MRLRGSDKSEMKKRTNSGSSLSGGENKYNKRRKWRCSTTLVLIGLSVWAVLIMVATFFFFEIELSLLSNTESIMDIIKFKVEMEGVKKKVVEEGLSPDVLPSSLVDKGGSGNKEKKRKGTLMKEKRRPEINTLKKPKLLNKENDEGDSHEGEVIDKSGGKTQEKEEGIIEIPFQLTVPEESFESVTPPMPVMPPPTLASVVFKPDTDSHSPSEQLKHTPTPEQEVVLQHPPTPQPSVDVSHPIPPPEQEVVLQQPPIPQHSAEVSHPMPHSENKPPSTEQDKPSLNEKDKAASTEDNIEYQEMLLTPGKGEDGMPVPFDSLTSHESRQLDKENFGYNEVISKKISLKRALPDSRDTWCLSKNYDKLSKTTSVLISVYNEALTVLLRSIHSVLERTPEKLLKEIVIIDDHSEDTHGYMKTTLPEYLKTLPKVKLFRAEQQQGLIKARNYGAEKATGDIIVFLDSHVEVNKGWLEPLVERIEEKEQNVVVPVVDMISPESFQYTKNPKQDVMYGILWDLTLFQIKPETHPRSKPVHPSAPFETPISNTGMFAISKKYFDHLGGFDDGLEHYGGENLELSLKTWMCGGRLEIAPCSRVGAIEEEKDPHLKSSMEQHLRRNNLRIAKVWMDEYYIYYQNSESSLSKLHYGDISKRLELKNNLDCKSFSWFLETKLSDLFNPKQVTVADSEIRSLGMDQSLCLDSSGTSGSVVRMFECHGQGGNQRWWYTKKGELRRYSQCIDYWGGDTLSLYPCHGEQGNQHWVYYKNSQKIYHPTSNQCMTVTSDHSVGMDTCEDIFAMQWTVDNFFNDTAYKQSGLEKVPMQQK